MKKTVCFIFAAVFIILSATACSKPAAPKSNSDFQYKLIGDGKIKITKYTGSSTSVTVPAELDGKKVTEIGEETFLVNPIHADSDVSEITLPEGLEIIGKSAFDGCSFQTVKLPSTLKRIEANAFFDCYKLTDIAIPHSVVYIGDNAFSNTLLEKFRIDPNPELVLGKECFAYTSMESVTVFPVKSSGGRTFACNILSEVTIPDNVTEIYDGDFYNCDRLKSVTVPSTVKTIGKKAFGYIVEDILKENGEEDSQEVVSDDFKLCGENGSAAQTYAQQNGIPFKEASDK